MREQLLEAYKEQLPKYKRYEWPSVLGIFATIVGLVATFIQFYYQPKNVPEYFYSIFLIILVIFLIIYTFLRESRRYHRYSESILHIYYAKKRIKEYITSIQEGSNNDDIKKVCLDITNTVSKCFSLLTGKNCNVTIKTLSSDGTIHTFIRDDESNTRYSSNEKEYDSVKHHIDNNTDFMFIKEKYKRYFISNNLMKLRKINEYENSSFQIVDKPKIKEYIFGYSKITNWNLPYKSTIVVPIRYISSEGKYYYYGFLCIDSNSRNIFNRSIDPELSMIFADIICTLMSQGIYISKNTKLKNELEETVQLLDDCTKPKKGKR